MYNISEQLIKDLKKKVQQRENLINVDSSKIENKNVFLHWFTANIIRGICSGNHQKTFLHFQSYPLSAAIFTTVITKSVPHSSITTL